MLRQEKKNKAPIYLSIFLAFIMVTSIAGFIFGGSTNPTSRYKGIKFTYDSQYWRASIDGKQYFFSFPPSDVETFEIPSFNYGSIIQVDVTSDANSTAKQEIAQSVFELLNALSQKGIYVRQGFTSENPYALPVIGCENATSFIPVIYYATSNDTKVSVQDNCIVIESSNPGSFLPYTDAIIYRMMGII